MKINSDYQMKGQPEGRLGASRGESNAVESSTTIASVASATLPPAKYLRAHKGVSTHDTTQHNTHNNNKRRWRAPAQQRDELDSVEEGVEVLLAVGAVRRKEGEQVRQQSGRGALDALPERQVAQEVRERARIDDDVVHPRLRVCSRAGGGGVGYGLGSAADRQGGGAQLEQQHKARDAQQGPLGVEDRRQPLIPGAKNE